MLGITVSEDIMKERKVRKETKKEALEGGFIDNGIGN